MAFCHLNILLYLCLFLSPFLDSVTPVRANYSETFYIPVAHRTKTLKSNIFSVSNSLIKNFNSYHLSRNTTLFRELSLSQTYLKGHVSTLKNLLAPSPPRSRRGLWDILGIASSSELSLLDQSLQVNQKRDELVQQHVADVEAALTADRDLIKGLQLSEQKDFVTLMNKIRDISLTSATQRLLHLIQRSSLHAMDLIRSIVFGKLVGYMAPSPLTTSRIISANVHDDVISLTSWIADLKPVNPLVQKSSKCCTILLPYNISDASIMASEKVENSSIDLLYRSFICSEKILNFDSLVSTSRKSICETGPQEINLALDNCPASSYNIKSYCKISSNLYRGWESAMHMSKITFQLNEIQFELDQVDVAPRNYSPIHFNPIPHEHISRNDDVYVSRNEFLFFYIPIASIAGLTFLIVVVAYISYLFKLKSKRIAIENIEMTLRQPLASPSL